MTAQNATNGTRQREVKTIVDNRQARHLYYVEDTFEAGLMLEGWEVKAILAGQGTFNGGSAFIRLIGSEAFLDGVTVTPLSQALQGGFADCQPTRLRKLLLKRTELKKLQARVDERGYTIVPLAITYGAKLKLQLGLAKGKKQADKRDTVKARDQARDLARELKDVRG